MSLNNLYQINNIVFPQHKRDGYNDRKFTRNPKQYSMEVYGDPEIKNESLVALMHQVICLQSRDEFCESLIAKDGVASLVYARDHLKSAFPAGEAEIAKNINASMDYAVLVLKGRFRQAEELIASNTYNSIIYVNHILKDRFPLWESKVFRDDSVFSDELEKYIFEYVVKGCKDEDKINLWPEAENFCYEKIAQGDTDYYRPLKELTNPNIPRIHEALLKVPSDTFAEKFHRWHEYQDISHEIFEKKVIESWPIISSLKNLDIAESLAFYCLRKRCSPWTQIEGWLKKFKKQESATWVKRYFEGEFN